MDKGHIVAILTYGVVNKIIDKNEVEVIDVDRGTQFRMFGKEIIDSVFSADEYSIIKTITRTEMAEILSKSYNVPFTVVYEKADGSERQLRGRLIQPEPLMGRVQVEDLDEPVSKRFRLVDNRTLKVLIVDGVRYEVKK